MQDLCLKDLYGSQVLNMVERENVAQLEKWGVQDHSAELWYMITAEEFGELAMAMLEDIYNPNPQSVVKEAIQTATLCLKIAEMYQSKYREEK